MVQARFSWGYVHRPKRNDFALTVERRYFGSVVPSVLNVLTLQGFLVLNCIVGGQTLSSVSNHLSWSVGIVVVTLISLLVCVPNLL